MNDKIFEASRLIVALLVFTAISRCLAKIQYLENGANYVRVCCEFRTVEAYEVIYDERRQDVAMSLSLNQTPTVNITMETFAFSNIHVGNVIPLIPRYNFTLYRWYILCFNTVMEQDCVFVRPCDCACDQTAWLKYNVTITADPSPSLEYGLTVVSQFSNAVYPLPVILTYNWFASDYAAIMMCKSGEISPALCDFMLCDKVVINTSGAKTAYSKSFSIPLDTDHLYFFISLLISPRWFNKLPFVDHSSPFEPQVVEVFRNKTRTETVQQYTVWQANEERLSGRPASSAEEKSRLCTSVGSLIMADQLKEVDRNEKLKEMNNGNNSGCTPTISYRLTRLYVFVFIIALKYF